MDTITLRKVLTPDDIDALANIVVKRINELDADVDEQRLSVLGWMNHKVVWQKRLKCLINMLEDSNIDKYRDSRDRYAIYLLQ